MTGDTPGICTVGIFGSQRAGPYCSGFRNEETSSEKHSNPPKVLGKETKLQIQICQTRTSVAFLLLCKSLILFSGSLGILKEVRFITMKTLDT